MKKIITLISFVMMINISPAVYAECQEGTSGGEILGTLAGAAIGGLIGSQFGGGKGKKIAIGAGVVAGGLLGHRIGKELTCQEQAYHRETTQHALEKQKIGQTSSWVNPDTGHSGEVTPTHTYYEPEGRPCRQFTQTIYVEGEYEEIEGTACREPDGTWSVVG